MMDRDALKELIRHIVQDVQTPEIPIGTSNRHIHLRQADYDRLFPHVTLQSKKELKQPGEFAAEQMVTLVGPKNEITKVRLLGPLRKASQVEISQTDARMLGVKPPIVLSGQLDKAVPITLKTEFAQVTIPCCIVAKRHIHVNADDAPKLGVTDGETVKVRVVTPERTTVFEDVIIRVSPNYVTEMHLDTDEANAAQVGNDTVAKIVR